MGYAQAPSAQKTSKHTLYTRRSRRKASQKTSMHTLYTRPSRTKVSQDTSKRTPYTWPSRRKASQRASASTSAQRAASAATACTSGWLPAAIAASAALDSRRSCSSARACRPVLACQRMHVISCIACGPTMRPPLFFVPSAPCWCCSPLPWHVRNAAKTLCSTAEGFKPPSNNAMPRKS